MMGTKDKVRSLMEAKGWTVRDISYERPSSGFKCVEGGWLVYFETEYDGEDTYELLKNVPMYSSAVLDQCGIITAMYADDLIGLVKSLPQRTLSYLNSKQTVK